MLRLICVNLSSLAHPNLHVLFALHGGALQEPLLSCAACVTYLPPTAPVACLLRPILAECAALVAGSQWAKLGLLQGCRSSVIYYSEVEFALATFTLHCTSLYVRHVTGILVQIKVFSCSKCSCRSWLQLHPSRCIPATALTSCTLSLFKSRSPIR